MPEKTDIIENEDNQPNFLGQNNKPNNNKCKKILKIFWNIRKENTKNQNLENNGEKDEKKEKKKKSRDLEEREIIFKKNMENSWSELPATLKRKKEKISEEILSEFHDSDSNDAENVSNKKNGKKSKDNDIFKANTKVYVLNNRYEELPCEYYRKKEEDEVEASTNSSSKFSEKSNEDRECSECQKNHKSKSCHSQILFNQEIIDDDNVHLGESGKLDKVSKSGYGENDSLTGSSKNNKNDLSHDTKTAVEELNSLFHNLIVETPSGTNSAVYEISSTVYDSDSANSDPYINATISKTYTNIQNLKYKETEGNIIEFKNETKEFSILSSQSDSLLNNKSSGFFSCNESIDREAYSEKSIKENDEMKTSFISKKDILNDSSTCQEINQDHNEKVEEAVRFLGNCTKYESKNELEFQQKEKTKEAIQYSNILFPLSSDSRGIFLNEEIKEDVAIDSLEAENLKYSEQRIIYQELDFISSDKSTKKEEHKHLNDKNEIDKVEKCDKSEDESLKKKAEHENLEQSHITVSNRLTEEQKAKKKSAEAIAKELSSQIFFKRNQKIENYESPNENSVSSNKDSIISSPVFQNIKKDLTKELKKEKSKSGENALPYQKNYSIKSSSNLIESKEKITNKSLKNGQLMETKENIKKEELDEESEYFSVADWCKAVALTSKRGGFSSLTMETIVEEPETAPTSKLSVREILKRFEELGNKHFSEKSCLTDDERTATLKEIHQTLKCLEEKVRNFEKKNEKNKKSQQNHENKKIIERSTEAWTGRGPTQRKIHSSPVRNHQDNEEEIAQTSINDGKHSLLQFAIHHFRQSPEKFEILKTSDGSISGSLKVIESKNKKIKEKGKGGKDSSEWTWKEQVDLVKFTAKPIEQSLLQLDTPELSDLAVECFVCLMRYMGDLPMPTDVSEVKCVYTILMHCHKFEQLRDEIYCHLMKQTTNNKSIQQESCQRGWRLFSIVAAYFVSSDTLKPFLFKYLETAAYDKRRAYHGTAMVCLQNLRKTFKYGGRKNVPSVEEITAISAGRNSKRQIYRLPGGTEKVVNTKSTTVVQDVIEELCVMINVTSPQEMEEFSVYCIVEGDTFTMPLAREEYILDVTTELQKNHQVFYLIFCRSVWYFPLRLDSQLYVEVVFNQIAPDYLEGLLLVMPGETLEQEIIYDISKVAALLHKAADMTHLPSMKETKFLLPKPALGVRDVKPSQWVNMVQSNWQDCENLTNIQAKAQVLDILSKWPLFGSSFFAVKKAAEPKERTDHILALNRNGVHFIDLVTHETLLHYPFSEVISTRKVKSEDGTLFLDMKCGNLMQQRITRLQTDQAHEISRLIRQYITMQQKVGPNQLQ